MKHPRILEARVGALLAVPIAVCLLLACGGGAREPAAPAANAPATDESWRARRPAPGPASAFDYPVAQLARLPNGVEVYLVPRQAGTVALSLVSRAGGSSC